MQSPAAPGHEPTLFEARDPTMSPATPSRAGVVTDPLIAETAKKIAAVINDFKRELDKRDGTWASAHGKLELALDSQTFVLTLVPDKDGEEYPVTVQAMRKSSDAPNDSIPSLSTDGNSAYKPMRRNSEVELERDLISRKKRRLNEDDDISNKRPRSDDDNKYIMPLIREEDLDDQLSKLRDDIQEDTSECVNHVHRLLRRFKDRHEKRKFDIDQLQTPHSQPSVRDSTPNGTNPGGSFPSPSVDRDDQTSSIAEVVRREAKLISTQVKWVEDCRRVAAELHDKREETWRTSSAGFHDRQRQDRENFQNRMLHESGMHSQTLNQILNEVKAIGLYAQSMKWETPASHLAYPPPSVPTPPAFPTRPASSAPSPSPGAGRGRGAGMASVQQPNQH
ncbi:hypothetical protein HBI55_106920 [Parastagonospora nodorum]|nr:hypothetical protein HBI55_106920 [Parastagonospora nodorum]